MLFDDQSEVVYLLLEKLPVHMHFYVHKFTHVFMAWCRTAVLTGGLKKQKQEK